LAEHPARFDASTPLPSLEQAYRLWDEHGMLDNIRRHSEVVCAVALLLAEWLAESGVRLRRQAVQVGALLHDIAKTQCLGSERRHDLEGEAILVDLGFPQLGYLVGRHVYIKEGAPLDETMVVNYADKRVNHEDVVNINQRYAYIAERYGREDPERLTRIEHGRKRCQEIERTIFHAMFHLHSPDEVARRYKEKL
jgi:putative nucleotidyltransferase with HDIG domain